MLSVSFGMRQFAYVVTGYEKRSIKNSPQIPFCKKQHAYYKKKITLGRVFHRNDIYIIAEKHKKKKKKAISYKVVPCSLNQRQFNIEAQKSLLQKNKKDTCLFLFAKNIREKACHRKASGLDSRKEKTKENKVENKP